MRTANRSKLYAIILGILFPILILFLFNFSKFQYGDTDRFFHFALSRQLAHTSSFTLDTLPAVEDLGWGRYFPDYYFLFHVVTTIGYRLGQDQGVEAACLAFTALSGLLIFIFALEWLTPSVAFLAAASCLFSHGFIFRMLLVRPHVIAVFFFLLFIYGTLKRRPLLAACATACYILTYHGYFIILPCLFAAGILAAFEPIEHRRLLWRTNLFGFFGLVFGILINPYFPSNIMVGWFHARLPYLMNGELKDLPFGAEIYAYSTNTFGYYFWFPLVVCAAALWHSGMSGDRTRGIGKFNENFLLLLSLFFLALTLQTPRASEYWVPISGLLLIVLLKRNSLHRQLLFVGLLSLVQLALLLTTLRTEARGPLGEVKMRSTWGAIGQIPRENSAKVYNCDWERAPFLFYQRPDLRFVDVLGPAYLYMSNLKSFALHESLRHGTMADAYSMLRYDFHADYVLCNDGGIVQQLRTDPGFQQLYPRDIDFVAGFSPNIYLFRLRSEPNPQFASEFLVGQPTETSKAGARKLAPTHTHNIHQFSSQLALRGSIFLNLKELTSWAERKETSLGKDVNIDCMFVYPSAKEIQRHAGVEYLGIGGGQTVKLWRNGKLIFSPGYGFPVAKSIQALVRIPAGLQSRDEIAALVCSDKAAPYWGLSLSFWGAKDLAAICQWKRDIVLAGTDDRARGDKEGLPPFSLNHESCLGEIAAPGVGKSLEFPRPELN